MLLAGETDPAALIRQGLLSRGMPQHVADAFIMNFRDESGLRTDINEIAPIVPGSRGGFGLAQWTGPRRRALEEFAASRGVPVSDMNVQLDFLMSELQGPESNAARAIMAAPDTATAADAILRQFLRPAAEHRDRRSAAYLGGQAPQQGQPMQQPQGLLSPTISTMNAPQEPTIWDALIGRLPERAQPLARRTIGDAGWRDRMAIALAGMSTRPNQAIIGTLQDRMESRDEDKRLNQTIAYLESIGRGDLAAAMAAGLPADAAIGEALRQPEPVQPVVVNDQLIDPSTGLVIGDYRDPSGQNREMREDQNGVLRYVDDGSEVFPGVQPPATPALSDDQLNTANALRDDLRTELQPFALAREGYNTLSTFYNNPGGVSDRALVVAFAKILDPGSVVRENESAAIASAGSLPTALQQQLLAVLDGRGNLPANVRDEIAKLGQELYNNQASRAQGVLESYRGVADQAGLPFESVYLGEPVKTVGTDGGAKPPTQAAAQPPAAGQAATPAQTLPPALLQNESFVELARRRNMTPEEFFQSLPPEQQQSLLGAFQ